MKKIITLLLTLISINVYSQIIEQTDTLNFNVQLKPEKIYSSIIETGVTSISRLLDSTKNPKFFQEYNKLKKDSKEIKKFEMLLITGKSNESGYFPLKIIINDIDNFDDFKAFAGFINEAVIYGHGCLDCVPTLDSIVSGETDELLKKEFLTMINRVMEMYLFFPKNKIIMGESFHKKNFYDTGFSEIKLTKIVNNVAEFRAFTPRNISDAKSFEVIHNMFYDISNNYIQKAQWTLGLRSSQQIKNGEYFTPFDVEIDIKMDFKIVTIMISN